MKPAPQPRKKTPPPKLRAQWRRREYLALERATQLDLFEDREREAAEALEKIKKLRPTKLKQAS
jgi:hypothetical protein